MNIFNSLKNKISIIDVIGEYTTLKKAGNYWKARCPFHHEKTASFTVSPHKEIFYCFGCHLTGDVIEFIAQIEHCSPLEAVHFLAERYNIELPAQTYTTKETADENQKNQFYAINKNVALWAHENLLKSQMILRYLQERGINQQSIQQFMIGYFPGGQSSIKSLLHTMNTKSILRHDLIQAHILSEGKSVTYSPFEERLLFPIKDHLSRFVGFGGRIIKPHDERPKYYNSRENELFIKGSLLFGFDGAKKAIQTSNAVFLVEGYTDCIAMAQAGFTNTVATLGTACTAQHLKLLSRYAQNLYILYDNDHAGQQAILRLTELCWQVNMDLYVISLPLDQDPASFLLGNSKSMLTSLIDQAKDIFVFFIDMMGSNFVKKPMQEKIQITRKLIDIIRTIEDPLKQDFLLQRVSKTYEIQLEILKDEMRRVPTSKSPAQEQEPAKDNIESADLEANDVYMLEKKIFSAIVNNMQLLNKENAKYLIDYMPDLLGVILKKMYTLKDGVESCNLPDFFTALSHEEKKYVTQLIITQDQIGDDEFNLLVVKLQKKKWKSMVKLIKLQLHKAQQDGDEEKMNELLNDLMQLQKTVVPDILQK